MFKLLQEVRDALEEGRGREREMERTINKLSTEVRVLRLSIDNLSSSHSTHPERISKIERYVWAASLLAAMVGVIGGGVLQSMISDHFRRSTPLQQTTNQGP